MQFLTEIFPILIFFYFFKYKGLQLATIATILGSLIQLIITRIIKGKYNFTQLASFISLLILGACTFTFKRDIFIKWKPTVIYWILAIVFSFTKIFMKKSLISNFNKIELPESILNILNLAWIIFFIFMGGVNLYVVYNFDTNTWVNFKLFGTLILTLIFVFLQAIFIYKHCAKT